MNEWVNEWSKCLRERVNSFEIRNWIKKEWASEWMSEVSERKSKEWKSGAELMSERVSEWNYYESKRLISLFIAVFIDCKIYV